jgi:excisionase family DNA binding protein
MVAPMPPRLSKVNEIAERLRVSPDAVYLWIKQGKIPAACVVRIAGIVRVDADEFELRLRSGSLFSKRRTHAPLASVASPARPGAARA